MPTNESLFLDIPPSPKPVNGTTPDTPDRLAKLDQEDSKSHLELRNETIFALEAEYDTFVSPEMYWGHWDQWCRHEENIYYYKYNIEHTLREDSEAQSADELSDQFKQHHAVVDQFLGDDFKRIQMTDVLTFFRNSPAGFPAHTAETLQFFQREDVGQTVLTIDELDKNILNKIQSTFSDNVHPFLSDLNGSLYVHNGKMYCTDYLAYADRPAYNLGVLMIPQESAKYQVGSAYFFPFAPLTDDQKTLITSVGMLELEMQGELVFVDL